MAQLITMRQRIKAVETIKKITHAMRLISMSSHTRLRHKKIHLERYKNAFQSLWSRIAHVITPSTQQHTTAKKNLIILAGSQKGLCGTFNTSLFKFFEAERPHTQNHEFIAIGKHALDYLRQHNIHTVVSYSQFTVAQFVPIAQAITAFIIQNAEQYETVSIFANYQKNFFVQKPRQTVIYPLVDNDQGSETPEQLTEYIFEQSPEELSATIRQLMLTVSLEEILFDSLLAEQAARFLSMDSSTRNADKLLVAMKLEYNKTRQAAITAELTELATTVT